MHRVKSRWWICLEMMALLLVLCGGWLQVAAQSSTVPPVKVECFPVTVGDAPETFLENTYVVFNPKTAEAIIIDPGRKDDRIEMFIARNSLTIRAILNTHGHFDHIGGNEYYADKYRLKVGAHQADLEFYRGKTSCMNFFNTEGALPVSGFEVKILHTPGHSPGSVCYLVDGVLFSGDTLFAGSVGRTWGATEADQRQKQKEMIGQIKSKLLTLPGSTPVYPGHEESTVIQREKDENRFLKN